MSSFLRNSGSAGFLPKHMIAGAIHGDGGEREGSWGSLGWLVDEGHYNTRLRFGQLCRLSLGIAHPDCREITSVDCAEKEHESKRRAGAVATTKRVASTAEEQRTGQV